jgi:4'-phosphopantetheinyl transferase
MIWEPVSQAKPLIPQVTHLWRINLDQQEAFVSGWQNILSVKELSQVKRFRRADLAQRYADCHVRVRQILSNYLDVPPEHICFTRNAYGKPAIAPVHRSSIQFNLSHSNDWALLAVTQHKRVGIDLEQVTAQDDLVGLAETGFLVDTLRMWKQTESHLEPLEFFKYWTLQESLLKAYGIGFSHPSQTLRYSVNLPDKLESTFQNKTTIWTIHQFNPADGFTASLTIEESDQMMYGFELSV